MSSNQPRSIDAPAPPWRLNGAAEEAEAATEQAAKVEEQPTDKAELAKRLVEQAKAKMATKQVDDDQKKKKKADLATQLVAEAKKKQANAKKAALASQLVAEAKKKHAAKAAAPKKAAPKKSLADRTRRNVTMSAKDALAAALAAEATKDAKKAKPKKAKAKAAPALAAPVAAAPAPVVAAPAPVVSAAPAADPAAVIAKALPKATLLGDLLPVSNIAVFTALWKANRTRAVHTNDIQGIVTANVLLEAVGRVSIVAAKVNHDGADWAVWVDAASGTLIAAATPAEIYLTGL